MLTFADTASLADIESLAAKVDGFTTNPTLMRKAGVEDYLTFVRDATAAAAGKPISFEVFADRPSEMYEQAQVLSDFGPNVFVKVPVVSPDGLPLSSVHSRLSYMGVRLNVTAVFTPSQVARLVGGLQRDVPAIVSVFAGRIADTGVDPVPLVRVIKQLLAPPQEVLWASAREVLNVRHAEQAEADIITLTPELLAKREGFGRDLSDFSVETVRMFHDDAKAAGYGIPV